MRTIIVLLLFFSAATYSCDAMLGQNFKPFMESSNFNTKKEPKKPNVNVQVERANSFTPSCKQPSFLNIEIENSAENFNAGYIFKFKGRPIKGISFPEDPVMSSNNKYFYFIWYESESELKQAIEATIEIIAILPNGKKSEPAYIRLTSSSQYH